MAFDLDRILEQAYAKHRIPEKLIYELCERAKDILVNESNLRTVHAPVTLVGDIHGIGGKCPDTNFIFLGDYVDRGSHSVETIILLTCLKVKYPHRVTLVRGNHESRAVTQTYGFYAECEKKYGGPGVWNYFTDMFDYMVLGVLIDGVILCVHGGLSPSIQRLDQIRAIDRFREIPHEGPMSDLVWSDPYSSETPGNLDFGISPRGAGFVFGKNIVDKFLHMNQLGHICRAHQLCMEGYQILFDDRLSTVWSAPNYCYRAGNLASILEVGEHLDRYFNVFGPCPDQRKEHVVVKKLTRLEQLLDTDGKLLKKTELESKGQGLAYSLNSDVDLETMTMDSLQYFT